jgi:D-sedoheptulose 7-phosphate isomerase
MTGPDDAFERAFAEHSAVLGAARRATRESFDRLSAICVSSVRAGGKIVLFGNGGSAADAQHLAAELAVRYARDRPPIAALALTTDTSVLTAAGNDLGFDQIFGRQVLALCRPGDVCIGISTSGRSENVVQGLIVARRLGCTAAALAGGDGGRLAAVADPLIVVPSTVTARVQEIHILLGHVLCLTLEERLTPS